MNGVGNGFGFRVGVRWFRSSMTFLGRAVTAPSRRPGFPAFWRLGQGSARQITYASLSKSSQSVNGVEVDTRMRSLIERSLLEHIPILVSSNDLIFLTIRVRLALAKIASSQQVDEKQIFDA